MSESLDNLISIFLVISGIITSIEAVRYGYRCISKLISRNQRSGLGDLLNGGRLNASDGGSRDMYRNSPFYDLDCALSQLKSLHNIPMLCKENIAEKINRSTVVEGSMPHRMTEEITQQCKNYSILESGHRNERGRFHVSSDIEKLYETLLGMRARHDIIGDIINE